MCGFIALLVTIVSIMLLYRVLINQNARFRKQCNAFFIDLVSTLCFKDNSPPCRAIILHLLSFLMVEVHSVPIIRGGEWVEMWVWAVCGPLCVCLVVVLTILFLFASSSSDSDQGPLSLWRLCWQKPSSSVGCSQTPAQIQVIMWLVLLDYSFIHDFKYINIFQMPLTVWLNSCLFLKLWWRERLPAAAPDSSWTEQHLGGIRQEWTVFSVYQLSGGRCTYGQLNGGRSIYGPFWIYSSIYVVGVCKELCISNCWCEEISAKYIDLTGVDAKS